MNSPTTLHTGAACFSKDFMAHEFKESDDDDVPLRSNGSECGEDDFLISESGDISLLIVADGVGSWRQHGIDPKVFTNELIKSIDVEFKSLNDTIIAAHDKRSTLFLTNIVKNAFSDVQKNKPFILFGSCTVMAVSLNLKTLHLNTYVLGKFFFYNSRPDYFLMNLCR